MTGYDEYGNPLFDRAISSADLRAIDKKRYRNGIFITDMAGLRVEAYNKMKLKVNKGFFCVQGSFWFLPEDYVVTLEAGEASDRTDRIVLQWNMNEDKRDVLIVAKKGDTSLTRTSTIHELGLCDVLVRRNVSTIDQAQITDLRLDSNACGLCANEFIDFDTTGLYSQYEDYLNSKIEEWNLKGEEVQYDAELLLEEIRLLLNTLETQTFAIINNNFDDISVKKGTIMTTIYTDTGKIETRKLKINNNVLCERVTTYTDEGKTEAVEFYDNVFDLDGRTVRSTRSSYTEVTKYNDLGKESEVS